MIDIDSPKATVAISRCLRLSDSGHNTVTTAGRNPTQPLSLRFKYTPQ